MANDDVVNFDTMRDVVLNTTKIESKVRFQFKWDTKTKDIVTTHISRSIRSTINEKRAIDGVDTKPFGGLTNAALDMFYFFTEDYDRIFLNQRA
jgi:hypothetical protein